MRTTLNIDAETLEKVMQYTGAKSKSKAVQSALSEWVIAKKIEALRRMRGSLEMTDDTETLRDLELDELDDE